MENKEYDSPEEANSISGPDSVAPEDNIPIAEDPNGTATTEDPDILPPPAEELPHPPVTQKTAFTTSTGMVRSIRQALMNHHRISRLPAQNQNEVPPPPQNENAETSSVTDSAPELSDTTAEINTDDNISGSPIPEEVVPVPELDAEPETNSEVNPDDSLTDEHTAENADNTENEDTAEDETGADSEHVTDAGADNGTETDSIDEADSGTEIYSEAETDSGTETDSDAELNSGDAPAENSTDPELETTPEVEPDTNGNAASDVANGAGAIDITAPDALEHNGEAVVDTEPDPASNLGLETTPEADQQPGPEFLPVPTEPQLIPAASAVSEPDPSAHQLPLVPFTESQTAPAASTNTVKKEKKFRINPTIATIFLMVILLVVALVLSVQTFFYSKLPSETRSDEPEPTATVDPTETDPEAEAKPKVAPVLAEVQILSYRGDDQDAPHLAGMLTDGDPQTIWESRWFRNPVFPEDTGIGLVLVLPEKAVVDKVIIKGLSEGGALSIRSTGGGEPTSGDVLAAGALSKDSVFTLSPAPETTSLVIWFSELPVDDEGMNRLKIGSISLE